MRGWRGASRQGVVAKPLTLRPWQDLTPSQCPLCAAEVGSTEEDWRRHILQEGCAAWNDMEMHRNGSVSCAPGVVSHCFLLARRASSSESISLQGCQSPTSQVLSALDVFRGPPRRSPPKTVSATPWVEDFLGLCTRVLALEPRFRIHCMATHGSKSGEAEAASTTGCWPADPALRQWMSFMQTAVARTRCTELVPRGSCRKGATLDVACVCMGYCSQCSLMTSQIGCTRRMPSAHHHETSLKSCAGRLLCFHGAHRDDQSDTTHVAVDRVAAMVT